MLTVRSIVPAFDRMLTLNRELDRALNGTWSTASAAQVWLPATDVVEKSHSYVITADLPGVTPESLDISFEKGVLSIRGSKEAFKTAENEELRVFTAERMSGAFERSFRLPEHVDGEAITAHFERGVLTLTVPKKPAAQPRKITVKAA